MARKAARTPPPPYDQPMTDILPANAGLLARPGRGFEYVLSDLRVGHVAAVIETAEVVHEHDRIAGGLQFARAFVVWIDAVDCGEAGTAGDKQRGWVRRSA